MVLYLEPDHSSPLHDVHEEPMNEIGLRVITASFCIPRYCTGTAGSVYTLKVSSSCNAKLSVRGDHLDLANLWVGNALRGALRFGICKALSVLSVVSPGVVASVKGSCFQ
jgi:hypothetical protein